MANFVVYELSSTSLASMKPENWLSVAVFGHMEHYNRSNVAPTESYKMSEHNIFLLQPFEHQQICKST